MARTGRTCRPAGYRPRYISICIHGLYLDTLTASEGAAILNEEVWLQAPPVAPWPVFGVVRVAAGRWALWGNDMRKLYVHVAEDRQLQASNRDPSVATPNRTAGTRPQSCWVPGPEGCPATARPWKSSSVADQGRLESGRQTPQCECLHCASVCTVQVPALCECLHCASACTMSIAAPMLSRAVGFCGALCGSQSNGGFVEGEDA